MYWSMNHDPWRLPASLSSRAERKHSSGSQTCASWDTGDTGDGGMGGLEASTSGVSRWGQEKKKYSTAVHGWLRYRINPSPLRGGAVYLKVLYHRGLILQHRGFGM